MNLTHTDTSNMNVKTSMVRIEYVWCESRREVSVERKLVSQSTKGGVGGGNEEGATKTKLVYSTQ